jgi:hypothetical protein
MAPLLAGVLALPHNPGSGTAPPAGATAGLNTIMDWTAYVAIAVLVICAIGTGVMLAASYFGHGSPKLAGLLYVGGGAIVVAGAASLVGGITG